MISTAEYRKKFGAVSNGGSSKVTETIPGSNIVDAKLLELKAKLIPLRYQAAFEHYEQLLSLKNLNI